MIGIDTNVLLRYLAQDDPTQSAKATQFIDSLTPDSPGFIPLITLAELYWVLDHSFKISHSEIVDILEELISVPALLFEHSAIVTSALVNYTTGKADFDDYLIAACAQHAGCEYIVTFDHTAAKDGWMQRLV